MEPELTIGQVARQSGLSRSTLLYYHRLGLLRPVNRSSGNYRLYSAEDVARLRQVCLYRKLGVPLREIRALIEQRPDEAPAERILRRRLEALETEIEVRQQQQREILRLLEQLAKRNGVARRDRKSRLRRVPAGNKSPRLSAKECAVVNKQRWVEIMTAAGFSEEAMRQWHRTFEKMEPEGHQEFLELLGLPAAEVAKIRQWSAQ